MTGCNITERLSAYLDGELPASEHQAIAAHLDTCPQCAAAYREMADISTAMQRWQPAPMSQDARRRLRSALDNAAIRQLRHLTEALSAVAAMLAIVAILSSSSAESSPLTALNTNVPQWEKTALRIDDSTQTKPVEVTTAEWVVSDLSTGGNARE
jgi:anti-sigma factor RsiW